MTRDDAKKVLSLIQAFIDGKEIQYRWRGKEEWRSISSPSFDFFNYEYRIKPEPERIHGYVNLYHTYMSTYITKEIAQRNAAEDAISVATEVVWEKNEDGTWRILSSEEAAKVIA